MDPQTLELLRVLQSGGHDARSFDSIRVLLSTQRARLVAADDRATLADISELLEVWAESATPAMAATALIEAAQIAEDDLQQAERAVQLYSQSLERDPGELAALHKLEPLLARRGERERFESLLSAQAQALQTREGVDLALPASLFLRLGAMRAERGELDAAIEAYEHVLDLNADADILRVLADAYAQRGAPADATQAADLYSTLGDVVGASDGVQWLERALDQVPSHDEALDLLESYLPPERHAELLPKRWQAYVDVSSNEPAADKRRMLLAHVLAARGDTRDALICLGPLIDRSDAEAVALQSECLTTLRADEARARESSTNGTAHVAGNGVAAYKPPTLVGFRVPPADPQVVSSEPVTETRPKPEPAVAAAQPEPVKRVRAARSGETLVGFRVPAGLGDRPSSTPADAEAEAAEQPKPVSVVALHSHAEAEQDLAPARAAGEPRAKSGTAVPSAPKGTTAPSPAKGPTVSAAPKNATLPHTAKGGASSAPKGASMPAAAKGAALSAAPKGAAAVPLAKIQTRATMKGGFTLPAATGAPAPAPATNLAKMTSGPAAAAAALKAAAGRSSSAPSHAPTDSAAALAKAAALRAALRDTMPATPANMPAALSAPRPASRPPAFPVRARSLPPSEPVHPTTLAGTDAPGMNAPVMDDAQSTAAPIASSSGTAPALIGGASIPAFDDASPFATRPRNSNRRWWIASVAALLGLGVVLALIFRPSSHPTAPALAARSDSQPALPAPVLAASTPTPTPVPSAPAAPAPGAEPTAAAATAPSVVPVEPTPTPAASTKTAPAPAKEATPAHAGKRSTQPEVKAVANQVKVRGTGVSAKEVVSALDDSLAKIEHCYGRTLEHDARAQGQITFGWTIDKAGRAAKVHKVKATIKDAALQRCAGDAIEKTHFPKPKKHSVQVTAPLDFHKA